MDPTSVIIIVTAKSTAQNRVSANMQLLSSVKTEYKKSALNDIGCVVETAVEIKNATKHSLAQV